VIKGWLQITFVFLKKREFVITQFVINECVSLCLASCDQS
jgi:hypothetical protein